MKFCCNFVYGNCSFGNYEKNYDEHARVESYKKIDYIYKFHNFKLCFKCYLKDFFVNKFS